MRKILSNNGKSKRVNGTKEGKIGTKIKLMDKHGNMLSVGDEIRYGIDEGILLYNHHFNQYGVAIKNSMLYGDDKYDINSYGKFVQIPMDNGARMELEVISR